MKANFKIKIVVLILQVLFFLSCKTHQSTENHSLNKEIEISEDFINIAKAYPVKQKNHKNFLEFKCENYQILNSSIKSEPVVVSYISKENKEIHQNYSELNFVVTNNLGGFAYGVSVFDNKTVYLIKENLLLIILGLEDEPEEEHIETNRIEKTTFTTSYDLKKEWTLISKYNFVNGNKTYTSTLTDGERIITIIEVKPLKKNISKMVTTPEGYEFVENNKTLCAYQTKGETVLASGKKKIIWLRPDIDNETNLVLVTAMASLKIHIP